MSKGKKTPVSNGDVDDDDFNAFLGASLSSGDSTIDTGRIEKYLKSPKSANLYDISDDDDDEGDDLSDGELMGTGKMFLKKKSTATTTNKAQPPQPAVRVTPNKKIAELQNTEMLRDSIEDESFSSYNRERLKPTRGLNGLSAEMNLNLGTSNSISNTETLPKPGRQPKTEGISLAAGKETLDEMAEKKRFFAALEREQGGVTVDYSRLNRELDQQETMAGATLNMADDMPEEEESLSVKEENDVDESREDGEWKENGAGALLAKVDLSMDSSYGSKPTASRDKGFKMAAAITESHEESKSPEASDAEGFDEPDAIMFQPSEHTDTHGVTMKTQTGYGDTSRDLEKEYRNAYGLGTADGELTLKDSSTLAGKSSMFNTQKTHIEAGTLNSERNENTPEFALKPVLSKQEKKDSRTADDLLRQAKDVRRAEDRPSVHFNVPEGDIDGGGAQSPRYSQVQEDEGRSALELSPIAKHHDSFHKPQLEVSQLFDSSTQQESTPIQTKKKQRERFLHVRSSGYGKKQPPVKKPSADIPAIQVHGSSADEVRPPLTDSTESMRARKQTVASILMNNASRSKDTKSGGAGNIVHNDKLMTSIASLVHQLQSEMTSREGRTPQRSQNSSFQQPEAQWSTEGPVLSASQRMSLLDREQNMVCEVRQWQEQYKEARKTIAKLRVDSGAQEKHYTRQIEQMKIDHEKELFKVKQENFVLNAKIADDLENKNKPAATADAGDREQIKLMEREIQEQEKLLTGYQQENERIYQELKTLQKATKDTETKMFKENQRLQNELANLKEELNRKDLELRNKGVITSPAAQQQIAADGHVSGSASLGATRIAQLEARLKSAMRHEEQLYQEVVTHKQARYEAEDKIQRLEAQRHGKDTAHTHAHNGDSELTKEVERLRKKVKWYAENQDFLDKDKRLLLAKDDEISRLRTKLNSISTESGQRAAEMRAKTKERSMDAKRIQDLERQVKEMENILKKRHPDSIPMMIWAANNLPNGDDAGSQNKPTSVQFLEAQLAKREKEVAERDEEAKRDIRVLEQKFTAMKLQYEDRINELEDKLSKYERPGDQNMKEGQRPHSSASAIQRELDSVRERSRKEAQDLRTEIERLKRENASIRAKEGRAESRTTRDKESDLEQRMRNLQVEAGQHERDKELLKQTIERLQKEKHQLNTEFARQQARCKSGDRGGVSVRERGRPRSAGTVRTRSRSESRERRAPSEDNHVCSDRDDLPAYTHDVVRNKYEPGVFASEHVSDTLRVNEELQMRIERLQLEAEQHRVQLNKVLAESEDRERRLRENADEQIHALKLAHQNEIQRVYTESMVNYSTSKMVELISKVDTQEVAIQFLKDQLRVARADSEQLATLKIREAALESQVKQLNEELREAKQSQTPEMRHLHALTDKISQLESRHQTRERELQQVVEKTRIAANADMQEEMDRWRRLVDTKNKEIEHFKTELDSILEVLKELQRQGVLLPYRPGMNTFPSR